MDFLFLSEVAMLYGTVILGLPLFVVGATFGQDVKLGPVGR